MYLLGEIKEEEEAGELGGAAVSFLEVSEYGRNEGMGGAAVSYDEMPEIVTNSNRVGGDAVTYHGVHKNGINGRDMHNNCNHGSTYNHKALYTQNRIDCS
jgi:hypothetical protein